MFMMTAAAARCATLVGKIQTERRAESLIGGPHWMASRPMGLIWRQYTLLSLAESWSLI